MFKILFSAVANATVAAVVLLAAVDVSRLDNFEQKSIDTHDAIAELIGQIDKQQSIVNLQKNNSPLVIDPMMALTDSHTCMQLNLYHEARGESLSGIRAVRAVTLARVASGDFPNNVCDVVWQPRQFEWTQDGRVDNVINDLKGWERINQVLSEPAPEWDQNITYYHSGAKPRWFKKAALVERKRIGKHIFYQE